MVASRCRSPALSLCDGFSPPRAPYIPASGDRRVSRELPEGERKASVYDATPQAALGIADGGGGGDGGHRYPTVDDLRLGREADAAHLIVDWPVLDELLLGAELHQVVHHTQRDGAPLVDVGDDRERRAWQRLFHRCGQVINEVRLEAESRHPFPPVDAALLRQLSVLHVDLLQRLDVLRDEADGHHYQLLDALRAQLADLVVCVRLEPRHGAHLALVGEREVIRVAHAAQLGHDELARGFDLVFVRVAQVLHVLERQAVRREEDMRRGRVVEALAPVGDQPRHRGDVPLAVVPRGDHHVAHLPQLAVLVVLALEQPQARARGGDGELRVERQHDEPLDPVALDLLERLLGVRVPVAHRDVRLGGDAPLLQRLLKRLTLLDGRGELWRASADGCVPLLTGGRTRSRDRLGDRAVQPLRPRGERDDLRVGEQVVQEGLDLVERVRAAQVEE
mmetsp:Transcript_1170/g.2847  ORF Transcript_1170/g.2847 Transcript_1170/m.2847 type:complete len:450 (-) Transcript_1170:208-1557(-)